MGLQASTLHEISTSLPLKNVGGRQLSPFLLRFWKLKTAQGGSTRCEKLPQGSKVLGGGSKYFYVYPFLGKWSNFDEHIFQLGWNHHLVKNRYQKRLYFGTTPPGWLYFVTTRIIRFLIGNPNLNLNLGWFLHFSGPIFSDPSILTACHPRGCENSIARL